MTHLEYFCTNNQAKYEVIMLGLQILGSIGVKHVEAFVDSLLVVEQVASVYQCFSGFFEWIDEFKLSPTPTLDDDEQYKDRHHNYEANQNAHRRRRGEDLIWVLVWKGKSITSISAYENMTFVKHIYVDVNADVIAVRLRFVQQD
jgi:ribonuclease HI